ncbi:MAG: DNA recombination protein RmuC [Alphaproteobacteria bacterium]
MQNWIIWITDLAPEQILALGIAAGFVVATVLWAIINFIQSRKAGKKLALLKEEQLKDKISIATYEATLKQEQKSFEEKIILLEESKQSMLAQFKDLSSIALKENASQFSAAQQEQLKTLLGPLGEKIGGFQKQVSDVYDKEMRERVSLRSEINNIVQSSQNLSGEAQKLSQALAAKSKTQGMWGELVLEGILEDAGLIKDVHYNIQYSAETLDGGRVVLDVLLHLPEDKKIIIDAKVSLRPWMRYIEAETQEEKDEAYQDLEKAIIYHVDDLSSRDYDKLPKVETLDSILMFIPQEAVLALINEKNPDFFAKALKKNILIVVPSTLMLSLRVINHLWKLDQQDRYARQIIIEAQALHKKFATFVEHLSRVKSALDSASKAYDSAITSMEGRGGVMRRIQKLEDMGVAPEKEIKENLIK